VNRLNREGFVFGWKGNWLFLKFGRKVNRPKREGYVFGRKVSRPLEYCRPGRVYMFSSGSTEVDPWELTCFKQVVLEQIRESLQSPVIVTSIVHLINRHILLKVALWGGAREILGEKGKCPLSWSIPEFNTDSSSQRYLKSLFYYCSRFKSVKKIKIKVKIIISMRQKSHSLGVDSTANVQMATQGLVRIKHKYVIHVVLTYICERVSMVIDYKHNRLLTA